MSGKPEWTFLSAPAEISEIRKAALTLLLEPLDGVHSTGRVSGLFLVKAGWRRRARSGLGPDYHLLFLA
ncbi:hypothetical protein GP486_001598 [Trichoglossum hirsutum]|uniref:Uncharacterized protein n=1 Tax=Trichoglossum hirsutum TaxID=265104 RepID=A0A9P8LGR7_9PEZI|nr:hypothetical protein GP486_001598 [Trichoglossum hirsutum]